MDERSERIAKRFERPLLVAAVLTVPVTILQLLPPADPWRTIADILNWAIWLTFLTEVMVMLAVVPSKRLWLRRNLLELAIVVLTPPVLPAAIQSVRVLRLLRLLRFLRLAPLVRALFSAQGLRYAAVLTGLTALAGGAAFAAEEKTSLGTGLYWAITTMTTVGYGDVVPNTTEGKVIAVAVMIVGIGFTSLIVGAVAQQFITTPARVESLDIADPNDADLHLEVQEISRPRGARRIHPARSVPFGAGDCGARRPGWATSGSSHPAYPSGIYAKSVKSTTASERAFLTSFRSI